jgi:energy-coupling factor transporter transmembrane protein EcfT
MARLGRSKRLRPVSSLVPSFRLLALLLCSTAVFFMGWLSAGLLAASLAGLLLIEGLKLRGLFKDVAFVLSLSLATFLIEGLSLEGGLHLASGGLLASALRDGLRLAASFAAGHLFYATTRTSELREAAEDSCRFLPGKTGSEIALALLLALSFMPLILEEWRASRLASRARGLPKRPGLRASSDFLAAFLRRLMLASLALPEALAARGWTGGSSKRPRRMWRLYDYCSLFGICLGLAVLILL